MLQFVTFNLLDVISAKIGLDEFLQLIGCVGVLVGGADAKEAFGRVDEAIWITAVVDPDTCGRRRV